MPHLQEFARGLCRIGMPSGFLRGARETEERCGSPGRPRQRRLELRDGGRRVARSQQNLAVQLARRLDRIRARHRPRPLRLERRRARVTASPPARSSARRRTRPSSSAAMICATSRASRSGTVFAAVARCSSAASARPGSLSGTLAMPSAKSSSMLSKLPCPFICAQSPLSTTSRAFIDASSLFSDSGPKPLPISLSTCWCVGPS